MNAVIENGPIIAAAIFHAWPWLIALALILFVARSKWGRRWIRS